VRCGIGCIRDHPLALGHPRPRRGAKLDPLTPAGDLSTDVGHVFHAVPVPSSGPFLWGSATTCNNPLDGTFAPWHHLAWATGRTLS